MKVIPSFFIAFLIVTLNHAQNVGIGTSAPAAKLEVNYPANNPSIPGTTSSGVMRIGISAINAMDFGKMYSSPYSGWMQAGTAGNVVHPISLQPIGGNVGIGTTSPVSILHVYGAVGNPSIPGEASTAIFRIGTGDDHGIDIGKMGIPPFSAWVQSGVAGNITEPLSLQPEGGNVSIGTTIPQTSAAMDVSATTQGFLPPRMTFAQRNGIADPATGLVIFCTDCEELQFFNGTIWKNTKGEASVNFHPAFVTICDQDWTSRNLDVSTYRNGDPIPKVTDPAAWAALTTGAYCYINNDSATYAAAYGKLYNWHAVNDPRGLAPEGWHIPSQDEYYVMRECLGGFTVAGGKIKEPGTEHWFSPNTGASNSSGFTARAAGSRRWLDGSFIGFGEFGGWWTTTILTSDAIQVAHTNHDSAWFRTQWFYTTGGLPVRCIRD